MAIARLLGDNALVRLIRGDNAQDDLIVSMSGIKLGERLIVIGLADEGLLSVLGSKVGITGHALGVDPSPDAVARARRRAEKDGVLVEVLEGDYAAPADEAGRFDIAAIRARDALASAGPLAAAIGAAREALRDGGRCLVLADAPASGWRGIWSREESPALPLTAMLADKAFRGARILAEREGLVFAEALKR